MNSIESVISTYLLKYPNKSNSFISTRILEGEKDVKLTHRTLRKKIGEIRGSSIVWFPPKLTSTLNDSRIVDRYSIIPELINESFKAIRDIIIISDLHGVFLDKIAFNCFLEVLKDNSIDELVINGDLCDLPLLSKHTKKLINIGVMKDYSEINELEFTKTNILKPLRDSTIANIVVRLGNHDERITSPLELTQNQLKRLYLLHKHYETTQYDEMLNLKSYNIEYDPTPIKDYYNLFKVIHGLSLSKNAPEKNIMSWFCSGTTGHSHRLNSTYFTKGASNKHYCWLESGHMRLQDNIEYLPTAVAADHQQGFVRVKFNEDLSSFFATTHAIINGECEFNGKVYKGS